MTPEEICSILLRAYPDALASFDGKYLNWHNGSSISVVDTEEHACPTLIGQFITTYPIGESHNFNHPQTTDTGRNRNMDFFKTMYGASQEEVESKLVEIRWMPRYTNKKLLVSSINGIDQKLINISSELERLPYSLRKFCIRLGGTYKWRNIADSDQLSPHSFGIAIDINVKYGNYWLWDIQKRGKAEFKNSVPKEIVTIFEKHGFIWGGKWKHYDTIHFEYRPELLMAADSDFGKTRVLFVNRGPALYGADRQLRHLVNNLSDEQFKCIIVDAETTNKNNEITHSNTTNRFHAQMRPWRKTFNILSRYLDAWSLLRFARKHKIDLIHCSYQWLLPYAIFVGKRINVPVITHIRRPNNSPQKLLSLGCDKCDAIIAISYRIERELLNISQLDKKVHLISDSVDLPSFINASTHIFRDELQIGKKVLFGLVARIYQNKRQLDFIKASKLLLDKGYDAHFVLVGDTSDKRYSDEINYFIINNNMSENVHLIGERNDIANIIASLDVLVSLAGGSVMYEAMAAGKTVISAGFTRPEDATHLINGVNGLTTSSKDIASLATLMERTILEPELRNKIGKAAQEYAQANFSVSAMTKSTEAIYNHLLNKP